VLGVGWLLGGTVGVGTLLYAVAIGPLSHFFIPLLAIKRPAPVPGPEPELKPARVPG
jgi:uncharacterized membrane protein YczE